jgi:hypothetical protein
MISDFLERLKALLPTLRSQCERDEDFLAEAIDIDDLERRVRVLETRGRHGSDVAVGLGLW